MHSLSFLLKISSCIGLATGLLMLQDCHLSTARRKSPYDSLRLVYTQKLQRYLQKDTNLRHYIRLGEDGIHLYPKPDTTAEFTLPWTQVGAYKALLAQNPTQAQHDYPNLRLDTQPSPSTPTSPKPTDATKPLAGWRIALDPGHIAGDMRVAKLEMRFIEMNLAEKTRIAFFESAWNWYTARLLQVRLEALGAEVLLTRPRFWQTVEGKNWKTWYQDLLRQLDVSDKDLSEKIAFVRYFNPLDFAARARKINEFRPHLTMIIHYNVDANNTGWNKPVPHNHSMAFTGGAWLARDADTPLNRFHLLRQLLTDDIPHSEEFSGVVIAQLQQSLGIAPIPKQNNQAFLAEFCLPTAHTGVYARNLNLTRLVYGTLCYTEPLYQDNEQECRALNERTYLFEGKKIPPRLVEVADAYAEAIKKYAAKHPLNIGNKP